MSLSQTASRLCKELFSFQVKLDSADHADSIAAISFCVSTLSDAFDCSGANDSTGANVEAAKQAELKFARNQVAYERRKRKQAEEEIANVMPRRQGNQIAALWYLRVGLARPTVPIAALSEFLRDFPVDATQYIGASSIRKAKDAFCSLVLKNNRAAFRAWRRGTRDPY